MPAESFPYSRAFSKVGAMPTILYIERPNSKKKKTPRMTAKHWQRAKGLQNSQKPLENPVLNPGQNRYQGVQGSRLFYQLEVHVLKDSQVNKNTMLALQCAELRRRMGDLLIFTIVQIIGWCSVSSEDAAYHSGDK